MKHILTSYGQIHYREKKAPGDDNYVFIHGNSLSHESFEKQFDLQVDGSMYFIDLPGHGESDNSNDEDAYSLNWFSQFVIDFLDELDLKNVRLIGHSLGGHIAMQTANKSDRVKGVLVFGAPPLNFPPDLASAFNPIPEVALAYKSDLTEDEIKTLSTVYTDVSEIQSKYQLMIKNTDPLFREKLMAGSVAGQMTDEVEAIRSSGVKFAVLNGAHDQLLNKEYLESKAQQLISDGTIHSIDGGHSIQLEAPAEFNATLKEILETF